MKKIIITLISIVGLLTLVACGGSSSYVPSTPIPTSPTTGNNAGFSNASLSGTYVFSANGVNGNNAFAVIGSFTADGAGHINSGTRDTVNDGGLQILNEAITGTYSVNQDGRGQALLNGNSGQVIYRFTMQSPSAARFFQISNIADATGRIQLQSAASIGATPITYIARLDGEDNSLYPYGAVGGLTFTGTTISGLIDENDFGTIHSQATATGTLNAPSSNGRGTLSLSTATGTHNFVYYFTSPSRIELISTDRNFFLHGYADQQTSVAGSVAAFAGDQVFNISGADVNGPVLETGRFKLDGTGNLANAIEDYNEAGYYYDSVPFTGTYSVDPSGRWTSTLSYSSSTMGLVGWQVSPQQSIVLTNGSSINGLGIVETGTVRAQTLGLATANVAGDFAEELSGYYSSYYAGSGYVESGGNLHADGQGNLNGTIDSQTPTSINTDVAQSGTYSVDPTSGRSSGTVGTVPVHIYAVDSNTIYLISTDPARLHQGTMLKQPQ